MEYIAPTVRVKYLSILSMRFPGAYPFTDGDIVTFNSLYEIRQVITG